MNRRCPYCGSVNVRRSGRLDSEATAHPFHSPYRCRECEQRFWVVSRKTWVGAAAGFAALAVSVIVWSGLDILGRPDRPAPPPVNAPLDMRTDAGTALDSRVLNDVLVRQFGTKLEGSPPPRPEP
jgi:hypothetical protein